MNQNKKMKKIRRWKKRFLLNVFVQMKIKTESSTFSLVLAVSNLRERKKNKNVKCIQNEFDNIVAKMNGKKLSKPMKKPNSEKKHDILFTVAAILLCH